MVEKVELGYLKNTQSGVIELLNSAYFATEESRFYEAEKHCQKLARILGILKYHGLSFVLNDLALYIQGLSHDQPPQSTPDKKMAAEFLSEIKQYILDMLSGAPDIPIKLWPTYQKLKFSGRPTYPYVLFFPKYIDSKKSREIVSGFEFQWIEAILKEDQGITGAGPSRDIDFKYKTTNEEFLRLAWVALEEIKSGINRVDPAFDQIAQNKLTEVVMSIKNSAHWEVQENFNLALYLIAFGKSNSPNLLKIKEEYQLDAYIKRIKDETSRKGRILDKTEIKPIGESFQNVIEVWNKIVQADAKIEELIRSNFDILTVTLHKKCLAFNHPAIEGLTKSLLQAIEGIKIEKAKLSETVEDEVASTLVLIEFAIVSQGMLSKNFEESAHVQIKRLLASIVDDTESLSRLLMPESNEDLDQKTHKSLTARVFKEVLQTLKNFEDAIDQWIKEPEADLAEIKKNVKFLSRIPNTFKMIRQPEAARYLNQVLPKISAFIDKDKEKITEEEKEELANAIATLSLFIESEIAEMSNAGQYLVQENEGQSDGLSNQKESQNKAAIKTPSRFFKPKPVSPSIAPPTSDSQITEGPSVQPILAEEIFTQPFRTQVEIVITPPSTVEMEAAKQEPKSTRQKNETIDVPQDPEMLEIYIEDFESQLTYLKQGSMMLTDAPSNPDALDQIRRAFHTLKGSGRMVEGLVFLPNFAEKIESFLKKWMSTESAATPLLIEHLDESINIFESWYEELKNTQKVVFQNEDPFLGKFTPEVYEKNTADSFTINQEEPIRDVRIAENEVVETAKIDQERLDEQDRSSGGRPTEVSEPEVKFETPIATPKPTEPIPEKEYEYIGTTMVDAKMYKMFVKEMTELLALMHKEWHKTTTSPKRTVSYEFMRSAHTIGSTSLTLNFKTAAEIGYLLERWSEAHITTGVWISDKEMEDISNLINNLTHVFESIKNKECIKADKDLGRIVENHCQSLIEKTRSEPREKIWSKTAITPETKKKIEEKLKKEIATIRTHLGVLEGILMLLQEDEIED